VSQGEIRSAKIDRGARQGWCLSPILCDWYSECHTEEAPEGFGDFRIGQVILTVKYADGRLLLAEEETVLQGMIDRLNEIGVEINVKKKLCVNLKATIFNTIYDRLKNSRKMWNIATVSVA
jgi:hypothetical protein